MYYLIVNIIIKTNNYRGTCVKMSLKKLFLSLTLAVFAGSLLFAVATPTKADPPSDSHNTDITLSIEPVLNVSLTNCDGSNNESLDLNIDIPTATGKFVSNCQNLSIDTNNNYGYQLSASATGSNPALNSGTITNDLIYQNPLPPSLTIPPTIQSTTNPITTPDTLTANTWGFAVTSPDVTLLPPIDSFTNLGSDYSELDNDTNLYANLPTSDTIIYNTDTLPGTNTFNFYYATKVTSAKLAGTYQTTITYTITANEEPPVITDCGTASYECILFTVDVGTTGTYLIPTSGRVADTGNTYDWLVYVDDTLTTNCTNGNCTGTGHYETAPGVNGITLTGLSNGAHQIKILPNGTPTPGWGNAFGHYTNVLGANVQTNKDKLITLNAPLTTMAFAPKSGTDASYMFANMFYNCANLTTPATIIDTYKLPNTITNLSSFFRTTHSGNTNLTTTIDLSLISGWFSGNSNITNLSAFLQGTHSGNSQLTTPINLSPLSDWFNNNNSITNLSGFLNSTHSLNSLLTTPINLSSLSGWFNNNTSITDLSHFLHSIHLSNSQLTTPMNLSPLSGWFGAGRSFSNLASFLANIHYYNSNLTLTGQTIFPNWIKTMTEGSTPIRNVSSAFSGAFRTESTKAGDTGEPRFMDGTVLSSIGAPNSNRGTYTGRTGITPLNSNWK